MASSVTKQQYYRRIMKEQKSKAAASQQTKITHPLARYNALDQLVCVLCNLHVKSEILWNTHLQSRKHKECVHSLKAAKNAPPNVPSSGNSSSIGPPVGPSEGSVADRGERVAVPPRDPQAASAGKGKRKHSRNDDPPDEPPRKKKSKRRNVPSATPASTKSGLPANFFDSGVNKKFHPHGEEVFYESSESEEEEMQTGTTSKGVGVVAPPSSVPADFFDRRSGSENTPSELKSKDLKKGLPEGFFDDPKKDAKARHVEYKDPMTEEWERFQKSIQKEDDISEVILFEGDEEAMEERELEEVNQQVHCFTKAEQLRQRHEEVLTNRAVQDAQNSDHGNKMNTESNSNEEDETDFDEFLNWRAKIS